MLSSGIEYGCIWMSDGVMLGCGGGNAVGVIFDGFTDVVEITWLRSS